MKNMVMKAMLVAMATISASHAFAQSHACTAAEIEILKKNKTVLEKQLEAATPISASVLADYDEDEALTEGMKVSQQISAVEEMLKSGICSE